MNPPSSKPAGETQTIDLKDVELLIGQANEQRSERSLPPPLPPEVRASPEPPAPPPASPPTRPWSAAPEAPTRPPTAFYLLALLVFLVVGVGAGLVAVKLRKPAAVPIVTVRSGSPQAAVITIPTVEVDDALDSGK